MVLHKYHKLSYIHSKNMLRPNILIQHRDNSNCYTWYNWFSFSDDRERRHQSLSYGFSRELIMLCIHGLWLNAVYLVYWSATQFMTTLVPLLKQMWTLLIHMEITVYTQHQRSMLNRETAPFATNETLHLVDDFHYHPIALWWQLLTRQLTQWKMPIQ